MNIGAADREHEQPRQGTEQLTASRTPPGMTARRRTEPLSPDSTVTVTRATEADTIDLEMGDNERFTRNARCRLQARHTQTECQSVLAGNKQSKRMDRALGRCRTERK
jgi:hypothetical protein